MNLAQATGAVWRWTHPAMRHPVIEPANESKEARAERSLAHLDDILERRLRWRHRARVALLIAVPLMLTLMARQARVVL